MAVAPGVGLQIAQGVGPAAGFGQRHHADGLASQQRRHILLDLGRGASGKDTVRAGRGLLIIAGREAHVVARQFLGDDGAGDKTHIRTADRRRKNGAKKSRSTSLGHLLAGKLAAPFIILHDRRDLGCHEAVERVAKKAGFVRQGIVHHRR